MKLDNNRIYFHPSPKFTIETIDKLIPVSKDLECREELEKLSDMIENNHAPYKRQIAQYEQSGQLTDIVKNSINALKEGMIMA